MYVSCTWVVGPSSLTVTTERTSYTEGLGKKVCPPPLPTLFVVFFMSDSLAYILEFFRNTLVLNCMLPESLLISELEEVSLVTRYG